MTDKQSLTMLAEDLKHVVLQLESAIREKAWKTSHLHAKVTLGLASRTFARLDGILNALNELEQA